jgi:ribosomal 50S subunit-recycling heat shock protein
VTRTSDSHVASDSQLPSMRLDVFLKLSRLIPRRTLAQEACDHGGIKVNGVTAKSSRPVRAGDLIEWRHHHKLVAVKVAQIPRIRPGKADAATLYEALGTGDVERPPE